MTSTTTMSATSASTTSTSTSTSTSSDTITTFAMTAIFTAPSSCSSSWTFEPEVDNDVIGGLIAQNCAAGDGFNTACFPSGFHHYGRILPSEVFSPGYCPDGYTSGGLSISDSTTSATCCLSGFGATRSTLGDGVVFAGCTSMFKGGSTIVPVIHSTADSTELSGKHTMWAQPISIIWQEKDLSIFTAPASTSASTTSSSTSSSTSTSSTLTSSSTKGASPTTSTSDSSGSSGLSTGASVGLGVGVGVAGMAILFGLAFWFFFRRKRVKASSAAELDGGHVVRKSPLIFSRNANPAELPLKSENRVGSQELSARTSENTSEDTAYELSAS